MGRTKRKRNKKRINEEFDDRSKALNLQKSLRLKCPNLQISYFKETGRGFICKKTIKEGDVLIAVPLHHLILPKLNCEVVSLTGIENQSPQLVLSVLLLHESHLKTESKYFEYIESLPESYTNLFFCTEEEAKLLPECMKDLLLKQTVSLRKSFKELQEGLGEKPCPHCGNPLNLIYTYEKFIWAWFTVNTRSVYYKDETNKESLALAPFLDLFNHSNDANTVMDIDFKSRLYILKSLVEYRKFEQVFIKYGSHSNLKLLLEYGFVTAENPHDFVEFSFKEVMNSLKEFDYGEMTKLKFNFIKANKLQENLTKNKEEFSWNLNGLIYVLTTKDENLSVLQSKTYSNDFDDSERDIIEKVEEKLAEKKFRELSENLGKMEEVENCTQSFQLAKSLLRIYMSLL